MGRKRTPGLIKRGKVWYVEKRLLGGRIRESTGSDEDRQDLLGHKSGRITTHYSAAELHNLIAAANKVCDRSRQGPVLTLLRTNREIDSKLEFRMPANAHKLILC